MRVPLGIKQNGSCGKEESDGNSSPVDRGGFVLALFLCKIGKVNPPSAL